jgi:hypothetical protein
LIVALRFDDKAAAEMRALQAQLQEVLLRANAQHVEAAIAAFALARSMRTLLDLYPDATRRVLLDTVILFLEHLDADNPLLVI